MSITISLPPDVKSKLEKQASAIGLDLQTYAAQLIQSSLRSARTLQEISGEVYQRFVDSGTTDDQLGDELEKAKHEMREQRRTRRAS